ncbi:hypothetical protein NBRC116599_08380 [Aquicoccus sp. SU-CL01552]
MKQRVLVPACKWGGGNGPQMGLRAAVLGAGVGYRVYVGKARRAANWWSCAGKFALGGQWCFAACGLGKYGFAQVLAGKRP